MPVVKPNVSVLLMWKWPLTAAASMAQPATLRPTTVSAIAAARDHSRGVSPARIRASRARGSAIWSPSVRAVRCQQRRLIATYSQQQTPGSYALRLTPSAGGYGVGWPTWSAGLFLDLALDPGQHG